ncbi:MAG: hypothetical protein HYV46_13530 [candidate division NC10 bacterium]|nr:hypothetical protein [candidate division NC10 bacterium]
MKRLIALAVMLVALGAGVGPTFAAMDPPKVPPKGIEGPDIRQNTMPQPKGVEGPDVR